MITFFKEKGKGEKEVFVYQSFSIFTTYKTAVQRLCIPYTVHIEWHTDFIKASRAHQKEGGDENIYKNNRHSEGVNQTFTPGTNRFGSSYVCASLVET